MKKLKIAVRVEKTGFCDYYYDNEYIGYSFVYNGQFRKSYQLRLFLEEKTFKKPKP